MLYILFFILSVVFILSTLIFCISKKIHVGERREKRSNGDIYIYERITAYNEKTRKTYTVSQKIKGKIKSGTQEIVPTRPKKLKSEGGVPALYPSNKTQIKPFTLKSTELK